MGPPCWAEEAGIGEAPARLPGAPCLCQDSVAETKPNPPTPHLPVQVGAGLKDRCLFQAEAGTSLQKPQPLSSVLANFEYKDPEPSSMQRAETQTQRDPSLGQVCTELPSGGSSP
ncbi:Cartilage-Associated Protein [Manis pentadactyla]|nr:Cartilage-Associated Protein [Manis pentadactyla]